MTHGSKRVWGVGFAAVCVLLAIALYFFGSWNAPHYRLPKELAGVTAGANSDEIAPCKYEGSGPGNGWFMNHNFHISKPAKEVAHLAKTSLLKRDGWTVEFPDMSSYCFNAEKRDKVGRIVCIAQLEDFSMPGGASRLLLTAYDPQVQAPFWRAWFAERDLERT